MAAWGEFGAGGTGGGSVPALMQEASPPQGAAGLSPRPRAWEHPQDRGGGKEQKQGRALTPLCFAPGLMDARLKVRPTHESCVSSHEFLALPAAQQGRTGGETAAQQGPWQRLLPPQRHAQPIISSPNSPSSHFHWGPGRREVSYSRHPSSLQLRASVSVVLTNLYRQ